MTAQQSANGPEEASAAAASVKQDAFDDIGIGDRQHG